MDEKMKDNIIVVLIVIIVVLVGLLITLLAYQHISKNDNPNSDTKDNVTNDKETNEIKSFEDLPQHNDDTVLWSGTTYDLLELKNISEKENFKNKTVEIEGEQFTLNCSIYNDDIKKCEQFTTRLNEIYHLNITTDNIDENNTVLITKSNVIIYGNNMGASIFVIIDRKNDTIKVDLNDVINTFTMKDESDSTDYFAKVKDNKLYFIQHGPTENELVIKYADLNTYEIKQIGIMEASPGIV